MCFGKRNLPVGKKGFKVFFGGLLAVKADGVDEFTLRHQEGLGGFQVFLGPLRQDWISSSWSWSGRRINNFAMLVGRVSDPAD
jgi:hypothetical protein